MTHFEPIIIWVDYGVQIYSLQTTEKVTLLQKNYTSMHSLV